MDYIYVGDIVNTHGLKGEVRILSDFDYKKEIFKKEFPLYIGNRREKCIIETYRKHKNYDMVTFTGIHSIDDVIVYKGDRVYINKKDAQIDGYFHEDLIGLGVYNKDTYIGDVTDIEKSKAHAILVIKDKIRIPYIDAFIESIDMEHKKIKVNVIEGLLDED